MLCDQQRLFRESGFSASKGHLLHSADFASSIFKEGERTILYESDKIINVNNNGLEELHLPSKSCYG